MSNENKRRGKRKRVLVEVEEEVDICTLCNSLIRFCVCPDSCFNTSDRVASLCWSKIADHFNDSFAQNSVFSQTRVYLHACEGSYSIDLFKTKGLVNLLLLDAILYLSCNLESKKDAKRGLQPDAKGKKPTKFNQTQELLKALEKEHKRANSSRSRKKEPLDLLREIHHPWNSIASMREFILSYIRKGTHEGTAREIVVKTFKHKMLEYGDLQRLLHSATSMLCSEKQEPLVLEEFSMVTDSSRESFPFTGNVNSYNDSEPSTCPINDNDNSILAPPSSSLKPEPKLAELEPKVASSKTTREDMSHEVVVEANVIVDVELDCSQEEELLSPCLVEIPPTVDVDDDEFEVGDSVYAWWWKNKKQNLKHRARVLSVYPNRTYDIMYENDISVVRSVSSQYMIPIDEDKENESLVQEVEAIVTPAKQTIKQSKPVISQQKATETAKKATTTKRRKEKKPRAGKTSNVTSQLRLPSMSLSLSASTSSAQTIPPINSVCNLKPIARPLTKLLSNALLNSMSSSSSSSSSLSSITSTISNSNSAMFYSDAKWVRSSKWTQRELSFNLISSINIGFIKKFEIAYSGS